MSDAPEADPFADGVVTPDELRGDVPEPPFACADCGLALGDESETTCPACGADLTRPGARVAPRRL
jgi:rubrerythrin